MNLWWDDWEIVWQVERGPGDDVLEEGEGQYSRWDLVVWEY